MRVLSITALVLLSLATAPARAVDGVIQINQASALAAGGFPVNISTAGSYVLTGNLQVSNSATAISVSVDDVRIDLNGFSITGPVTCSASIDGSTNRNTATTCTGSGGTGISGAAAVSNGTIRGFGTGISASSGQSLTVDHVTIAESSGSAIADNSVKMILEDSVLSTNGGRGVSGQDAGTFTVDHCVFEKNGDEGMYLSAGVARDSTFSQNVNEGIRANIGRSPLVTNSYFEYNGSGLVGDAAYQSNIFHSNGTNVSAGRNLGGNVCDSALCP